MEIWKAIKGLEGSYEVSDLGNVRSLDRVVYYPSGDRMRKGKLLKPFTTKGGYLLLTLQKNKVVERCVIHRLVAKAFIPNPDNLPQVNHKNGIKTDNRVENLEWVTASENRLHAFDTGLQKPVKGEGHGRSKLTEDQAYKIKFEHKGLPQREVAKIYGTTQINVSRIRRGIIWSHITE